LAIIDHGRILTLGTPAELKASTGVDTIVMISAEGDLAALAEHLGREIEGATGARVTDGGIRLDVKGSHRSSGEGRTGVLPAVVRLAEEHGVLVTDLTINEPTLETVFIDMTGKELRE
jgi:ABC-2 type transport system ATP-binding protein